MPKPQAPSARARGSRLRLTGTMFLQGEAKAKLNSERLAKLQEEERDALLLRSQPMRKYFMDNVLPSLTRGLQEVAKVRPDDPVDYLAEYLFNLDPELA